MSMVRHRAAAGGTAPTKLVYSSRTLEDVIYRSELDELAARGDGLDVVHTLTREQPEGWAGYARRIDPELLSEVAWPAAEQPRVYVCGSTRFVDAAADGLLALGYEPQSIRTERFGATGS
jgi:ferredoxin-NADP reductase